MMPSLNQLLAMVGRSIVNPREGAEEVLALGVPRQALFLILLLVVVLSILFGQITALVAGPGGGLAMVGLMQHPVALGALQLGLMIVTIAAVYGIGRVMQGSGTLPEAVLLMSWLQFIMVCLQVAQTLALIVLPPLGGLVGIAALLLFLWLLTNFVAVLHGFRSLGAVFLMILASTFAIAFFLSILLTAFGVGMDVTMGPN